ncbi:hypothetical protein J4Q44_G00113610 [Coregonus suidteri]|uniref:Uncharacterized protein n=1 Tax=Coregonus suidteri TaxID=861788 RepID=A0AAN8M4L0_9TELE
MRRRIATQHPTPFTHRPLMPSELPNGRQEMPCLCQEGDKARSPEDGHAESGERGAILGDIAAALKVAGLAYEVWMWSGQEGDSAYPIGVPGTVWTKPLNNHQTVGNRLCHCHRQFIHLA